MKVRGTLAGPASSGGRALLAAVLAAALANPWPARAEPQDPSPAEKKAIAERLAPTAVTSRSLTVEEGGTLHVVHTLKVPAGILRGGAPDFEGFIGNAKGPAGVRIHRRLDAIEIGKQGDKAELHLRYVISVEPGTKRGGKVSGLLRIVERAGLGNEIAKVKILHEINVKPPQPSEANLGADFRGYRMYRALARSRVEDLGKRGFRVGLQDDGELGQLDRLDSASAERLFELDRWRRRMATARRHLEAAGGVKTKGIAALAKKYLDHLESPDAEVEGLAPPVAQQSAPQPAGEAKMSKEIQGPGGVAILEPLEPSGARKERQEPEVTDAKSPVRVEPRTEVAVPSEPPEMVGTLSETQGDDFAFSGQKERSTPIPVYPRGLTLDDPNLAYGGSLRFGWAKIADQQTAVVPALFVSAQTAVNNDFGLDLTIPIVHVSVNLQRADSITILGNPLLGAKFRLHLPEVEGRRPVLTLRGRWGIPVSPLNTVPRTQLSAEQFSVPAYFVDTYAFLLEKWDFGLGAIAGYQIGALHLGAQVYADYFAPVKGSTDRSAFLALSYGLSIGVRPFPVDFLGFYAEGRGTTLLSGPRRSEFFTYLGARGHFLSYVEPAVWICLPLGSVGQVSSLQFGGELRFSYDVEGAIEQGKGRTREPSLLE